MNSHRANSPRMNTPRIPRTSRLGSSGRLALLILSLCLGLGCAWFSEVFSDSIPLYRFDPQSVNVAQVSENWPKDQAKLPKVQQEVIRQFGVPDYVHLWWNRNLPITSADEVRSIRFQGGWTSKPLRTSWIYLEKRQEVDFKKNDDFDVKPLDERIRVLCEMGDPDQVKQYIQQGDRMESWIYYGRGRIYRFVNEKLVGTDNTPAIPGWTGG